MPEHAYHCECGKVARVFYDLSSYPYPEYLPCKCGQSMTRFFEGAPGIAPDIWNPYYDTQLGATVTSRKQRDAVAKSKGFDVIMGKDEFNTNVKTFRPREEFPIDREKLGDACDKAWNDLKYGNVEVPPMPEVDPGSGPVVE